MNTVSINTPTKPKDFHPGDIFKDEDGDIYILAETGRGTYVCICLRDGNRWTGETQYIGTAVESLEWVGRDFKITLSK